LFEKRWNNRSKRLCYDEASKIPLLMKYPRVIPSQQGSQMPINSVDITPTILGLAGISTSHNFDGTDLGAAISGKSDQILDYTVTINVPHVDKKTSTLSGLQRIRAKSVALSITTGN